MLDIRPVRGRASGDRYSEELDAQSAGLPVPVNAEPLDSEEAREELKRLLGWFYLEKDKQAENRLEMAMDHDFYDNLQWDPEDAAILRDRGQQPLVYNEIAPMCDWIIGTERRTRVDWGVLPRTEDDVESADTKEQVMKYVSDVNRIPFTRSRAFADAVKGGLGWVDDGARDDPTQDILYSKYEDWRNVLHDSSGYELDLSDARYVFRWRWVDEDVALMMFPNRANQIRSAVDDAGAFTAENEEDTWYFNEKIDGASARSGKIFTSGASVMVDAVRRRVRLIECQYRKPAMQKIVTNGPFKGAFFNEDDQAMGEALAQTGSMLVDRVVMRVHFAVFTEAHMLSMGPSIYRHNRFGLTPIWCYRRSRDRQPYGVIRRVRDIQQDLNKRASKALFLLNTNQIFADEGAVEDWSRTRDEVDRPDGNIVKKKGYEFTVRRDTDAATGQLQMMTLAAQSIQKTAGVNNENLGRATNAVSGAAIEARQQQGAVGTTEPFDNLRLMVQIQGEKQLSLSEQFYTEEKVIRLTGKGKVEWLKVNQPEVQPDGSVRYINDITSSMADFVVAEQDYAGTLRQVMFDSLNQIAGRLAPEIAVRFLRIAFEFSDMPNKDEIVEAIRQITGEVDPNKELSPEEQQQQQEQIQAQAESMQLQREMAIGALEEQKAKVRELNAKAAKAESEATGAGQQGGISPEIEAQFRQLQSQAADQIDALSEQLRKVQADAANKTMAINREADVKVETARIDADALVRVAEIQKVSDKALAAIESRMEALVAGLEKKIVEQKAAPAPAPEPAKPEPAPAPVVQPAAPITLNVQIDAKGEVKKSIKVERDKDGVMTGASVVEDSSDTEVKTK
jgi:hypothetical protein